MYLLRAYYMILSLYSYVIYNIASRRVSNSYVEAILVIERLKISCQDFLIGKTIINLFNELEVI
jgi:hypothetical protein